MRTDKDLAAKLGTNNIVSLHQVHGARTITLQEPSSRSQEADAIATDEPNLWLSIRAADCQQFIVYAPAQHVCAVIHAGWKGLKAGTIQSCFSELKNKWNIEPSETYVGIGPSLCTNCAEFTDPIKELEGLDPSFFHGRHAHLQGIADAQLAMLGIPDNQRERSADCTKCKADLYWSYRGGDQEKVKGGFGNVMTCCLK